MPDQKQMTKRKLDLRPSESDEEWAAEGWAEESEPLTVAPRLAATISIRLDPEDAQLVRQAARLRRVTQSQFVRRATVGEAKRVIEDAERRPVVLNFVKVHHRASAATRSDPRCRELAQAGLRTSASEVMLQVTPAGRHGGQ